MSLKWTGTESGILRKSEFKEKKEELFVFGYSCKLFRDDDRALLIDQGKHLIPWMGDETLKIDRYDARGALHDLSALEAPQGGFDWRVELTRAERDVEQRCDEERYRALHTDEDEEEMYKEEELKRLHAAGYGQVGFNYDAPLKSEPAAPPVEADEPFVPTPSFKAMLPHDVVLPESDKQNVIIEKTATFIALQGAQMEILIKAKQGDNPQFQFLNRDSELHPYYMALIGLVKAGKWPEKKVVEVEEKPLENEDYLHPSLASTIIESAPSIPSIHYKPSADCDYTMLISKMRGEATLDEAYTPELAPGEVAPPGTEPLPPRATAEISRAPVMYNRDGSHAEHAAQLPAHTALTAQTAQYQQYAAYYHQYLAQTAALHAHAHAPPAQLEPAAPPALAPRESTGLSLMRNYNTDSGSDVSDSEDSSSTDSKDKEQPVAKPPEDVRVVIDKMAAYVARNGDEFAAIVRAKRDPRFTFLEPGDVYHAYYTRLMREKRGVNGQEMQQKNTAAPVSFSIKKLKEPDPILPKPALPYESSSDEESENKQTDKQAEKQTEKLEEREQPKTILPQAYSTTSILQVYPTSNIPPVVVYKMEGPKENNLPTIKAIDPVKVLPKPIASNVVLEKPEPKEERSEKIAIKDVVQPEKILPRAEEIKSASIEKKIEKSGEVEKSSERVFDEAKDIEYVDKTRDREIDKARDRDVDKARDRDVEKTRDRDFTDKNRDRETDKNKDNRVTEKNRDRGRDSPRRERKHKDRKREHSAKCDNRESRRSVEREQKKDRDSDVVKKTSKYSKDDLENEIISLEDNSDDMIDLTGDISDSKGEYDGETDRMKQQERRRRAAEFLKKVGVDPSAAALPTNSLASAMVDTLESLRKKKAEEEEKRRKREKRRHHRDRHGYSNSTDRSHRKSKRRKYRSSDENEESDYDGSKKKKRKKDKKSSRSKKKRRRDPEVEEREVDHPLPPDMDLTTTLKELRTSSPTKELGLQDVESSQASFRRDSSTDEENVKPVAKRKKEDREYSEGEWSSDSEGDSGDSSRNGD